MSRAKKFPYGKAWYQNDITFPSINLGDILYADYDLICGCFRKFKCLESNTETIDITRRDLGEIKVKVVKAKVIGWDNDAVAPYITIVPLPLMNATEEAQIHEDRDYSDCINLDEDMDYKYSCIPVNPYALYELSYSKRKFRNF